MATFRFGVGALLLVMGCTPIDPAQNTFPQQQQPVSGPPGGGMDPGYGYAQPAPAVAYNGPDQPGYPQGYAPGYPDGTQPSTEDQAAEATANGDVQEAEPSADPNDAGYDMGQVDDTEIDATLEGYGSWQETDDYGRVWRPDTTAVGVDFTPYETCGSWLWSDAGWNFSCDYSWGWLPFHYGRWGWFDGYWGWQPGYAWSPGAVEWRGGGGYTGWRPLTPIVRDHRGNDHNTPIFHDHRHQVIARDSQWRFTRDSEFGTGHIRGHLFQDPAEGLRATANVSRPAIKANYAPISSASIMRARLGTNYHRSIATGAPRGTIGGRPAGAPAMRNEGFRGNAGVPGGYRTQPSVRTQAPFRGDAPTWRRPDNSYRAQPPTYYRPPQAPYRAPQQTYRPTYRPPAANPGWSHSNGGYQRPSYTAPSSSSWSHSSGGGGGGWSHPSAPSRSFGGGGGGGGVSHSSGGGGGGVHSSGGGGGGGHSGGGGRHR